MKSLFDFFRGPPVRSFVRSLLALGVFLVVFLYTHHKLKCMCIHSFISLSFFFFKKKPRVSSRSWADLHFVSFRFVLFCFVSVLLYFTLPRSASPPPRPRPSPGARPSLLYRKRSGAVAVGHVSK